MSLYDEFEKLFNSDLLNNKNKLSYYFEGIPSNNEEKIKFTNELVKISSDNNDHIKFVNGIKLDDNKLLDLVTEIKQAFKFKDLSQEQFIINKCVNKLPFEKSKLKEIKEAFNFVLKEYKFHESNHLTFDSLVNFCAKLTCLIIDNKQNEPTIVCFGNLTKAKIYYLRFINYLKFNTIIINTYKSNPKSIYSLLEDYYKLIKFDSGDPNFIIPDREIVTAIETNAYKAEQQVNMYYNDNEENKEIADIVSVPIKTSYEDLINLWLTPANERQGYKIRNGIKYIPNFICKINGVEEDEEAFRNKIQQLITEDTIVFMSVYEWKNKRNIFKEIGAGIRYYAEENDDFDRTLILKKNIRKIFKEKLKEVNKKYRSEVTTDNLLDIIQRLDKDNYNPKLFVFHNDKVPIETLDQYKLYQSLGFDIIMLSPSGYAGIEDLENCNLYELDKYDPDFKIKINKKISIIRKLFGGKR